MTRVEIKPELMRWARERAGFSVDALAPRFPKLGAWERGEALPTMRQVESFAKATYTPVGYLFLPQPPEERVPVPDLRTVGNVHLSRPSPDLLDTLYICQQRQAWYRDLALAMGDAPLELVGSVRLGDDVVTTATTIRAALGLDMEERRHLPTWTDALRRFIEQADTLGVLVMSSGVVGNNNRRHLDPEEFRGFALSDPLAPLVFINGADSKAAQMFTLAHELVHIWLGRSALSDAQVDSLPTDAVERWCNRVAAEILVPSDMMRDGFDGNAPLHEEVTRQARRFKVSSLVILRRIYDTGSLTRDAYRVAYDEEVTRLRVVSKGTGGNFYRTVEARVSKRFARALVVSTLEGRTSFTESFRLLGIKKLATFHELGRSLGVPM